MVLPDPEAPGEYLRSHSTKNNHQTKAFLSEIADTQRHEEIVDWFLTLPLWLDLPELRAIHACWHPAYMDFLASRLTPERRLTRELMVPAGRTPENEEDMDTPEPTVFKAVEVLLKGMEIPLPKPHMFKDKDGHERNRVRVRWWNPKAVTYREAALVPEDVREQLPCEPIPEQARLGYEGGKPVFFGHYWLIGTPEPLADRVACVDYSVAKNGKLVAYRWEGEPVLDSTKFRWVGNTTAHGNR